MWTRDKYNPQPINTEGITIPEALQPVRVQLATSVHDTWALTKIEQGEAELAETGSTTKLDHEDLIDFNDLTEPKQAYDFNTVDAVLLGLLALGYVIMPASEVPNLAVQASA